MIEQFKQDVLDGLSLSPQKTIPSKYFYDRRGDELFVQIMSLPEYYLTRAEMEIFTDKTDELIAALHLERSRPCEVVELGPGDGVKTLELLRAMIAEDYRFVYVPIDISQTALDGWQKSLKLKLPSLTVIPKVNDYFSALHELNQDEIPKIILFLGSNIGNLSDRQAANFFSQLGANLRRGDRILLGVDLIKPKEIVLPAYDDPQGITREFNLNLLERINRELGGNFDRNQFEHVAEYEEAEGIARSYLRSKIKQSVTIESLNATFHFEAGETIHTEISRKYNDEILHGILAGTDLTIESKISDSNSLFADYILLRN